MAADNQIANYDTSTRSGTARAILSEFKRAKSEGKGNAFGYLFIAPALILYLIFNIWPLVRGFLMAFTDYRFIYPDTRWDWIGFSNFIQMFTDKEVWSGAVIALKYALIALPGSLIVALFIAVLISQVKHFAGFYRWVVYLPVILPTAVTILLWKEFLNQKYGFINVNLEMLGVAHPPNWLGLVQTALPTAAIVDIWRGMGFPTLLFLIGIYNINSELWEAASIDGANKIQQFTRITLPLLKPTFALLLVLNSGVIGVTESLLLLTNGGPQNSTMSVGLHLYKVAFQYGDMRMGYSSAVSLVIGLIAALLSLFWFKLLQDK